MPDRPSLAAISRGRRRHRPAPHRPRPRRRPWRSRPRLVAQPQGAGRAVILALFALLALLAPLLAPGTPPTHGSGRPAAVGGAPARHHGQGPGRARPDPVGRAQLAVRRLLVGLGATASAVSSASPPAYFGAPVDDAAVAGHQRVPAHARAAAAGDPGRVPAAGAGDGHRSCSSSPAGRVSAGAPRAGAVHPRQGLRRRRRRDRRARACGSCSARSCPNMASIVMSDLPRLRRSSASAPRRAWSSSASATRASSAGAPTSTGRATTAR